MLTYAHTPNRSFPQESAEFFELNFKNRDRWTSGQQAACFREKSCCSKSPSLHLDQILGQRKGL